MAKKVVVTRKVITGPGRKKCECGAVLGVRKRVCDSCGKEFPVKNRFKKNRLSQLELINCEIAELEEFFQKLEEKKERLEQLKKAREMLVALGFDAK